VSAKKFSVLAVVTIYGKNYSSLICLKVCKKNSM